MLAHPAHVDPVAPFGQHVAHALFRGEEAALLVDHHAVQRLGQRNGAAVRCQFAGQQLEQGRLARAVGSDQADPVTALDPQRKVLDDRAVAELLVDLVSHDDRLGLHLVDHQFHLRRALGTEHGGPLGAHFPQLFQAALVALASCGDAAFQPVRLDLQFGIQLVGRAGFLGIDLFHPGLVTAKADLLAAQAAAVEPQGSLGQPLQEGTVVADHHESAGIAVQPGFQPVNGGKVQVVGRLVQQEQVGV